MSNIFPGVNDAPTNVPGWSVQNAATGSNQNSVNGGAAPTGGLAGSVAAQTPIGTVSNNSQATVQSIAAGLDALNAALVAANIEV
jgi:hypothetical protein